MTAEEYKKRYVEYMVAQSDMDRGAADLNFENGFADPEDLRMALEIGDPEGVAADEISYWD